LEIFDMELPTTQRGDGGRDCREILLVGSVGLKDTETVLRTVASRLGTRMRRLPDGETGPRSTWSLWPRRVIDSNPAFEIDPAEAAAGSRITHGPEGVRQWTGGVAQEQGAPPPPRMRIKPAVDPATIRLGAIGYAEVARDSYAVFRTLRAEGVIRPGIRFQVSLPTTAAFLNAHVVYAQHPVMEPLYRDRLLAEVDQICDHIPAQELTIQWDVSTEMAQWEGVRHAHFPGIKAGVIERLARHCERVPAGVELGVHLCYGSYGNRHWKEPEDSANMVEVCNRLCAAVRRPIHYVHMPVPANRSDRAYFAPLAALPPRPETKLFLGLIHDSDGLDGTRRRIAAAAQFISDFGVATECGFGRRPPETIPELLRLHAEV